LKNVVAVFTVGLNRYDFCHSEKRLKIKRLSAGANRKLDILKNQFILKLQIN